MRNWSVDDVPRLDDHVIVVTGANSGLGFEATRVFAQRGATVVMACRSVERGNDARRRIEATDPDGHLDVRECDLGDRKSIQDFSEGVHETYDSLDVLCNNAGVMAIPRRETADGFEAQFGVNHLGHFALTGHLLDLLRTSNGEARVVTQSSGMHERGEMDFDDLHGERNYDKWDAYGQSKLANVLFAYELQRRLDAAGIDEVTSVAVHPGYADTNLQARTGRESGSKLVYAAMKLANTVFAQSARKGALPMLYAAVVDDLDGGSYVGPGGFLNMRGAPDVQRSSDRSYDRDTATRLWDVSEDATGVTYDLPATAADG
ncbi:oxidoreductase [Halapricum hydrolyticum]|uniref:Oxidoreductase n=1 Tax=Halapricum hydrolyticum TaxID=2979991 RepID=A0AAE3IBS2_9EURY|nr:oxidoreductase [Halapricum hydrolyticum]MCU4718221.1 oxidoreductase [Halapricum hydrolyticum]MCU4726338.1 oxidoreductase [Halapricum hydrolyticum]